ncbi:hypothetical protein E1287_24450 [Actinomadura sp. KC06]|uniref:hypothetical protein n=1 Tax=Actinomadura sp. KC06 TaxID=2530369 RepID=UPI0010494F6D|nr:hypothetical protein [Actinomadura sp. KC06]TDD32016.1 hypothetical protein E1287_24450 [Actinomadura sp. KC06]
MSDFDEWTPADSTAILINPYFAIDIDPTLTLPHGKPVSEEHWIDANAKMIRHWGAEVYLQNLLAVLKGNYPRDAYGEPFEPPGRPAR